MTEIIENLKFNFVPEEFKVEERKEGASWIRIGGTALTEGVSRNKNVYTIENLKENDQREFKWLVGHPDNAEAHVVGRGTLSLVEGKLVHEGKIRNTANHPDIIESVVDGFVGPSIHATANKVTKKEDGYYVEGLEIDGVGLVAFQGVKQASIDYALAESFDKAQVEKKELDESSQEDESKNNDKGDKMSEEKKLKEEETDQPEEKPEEEPAPAEEPKEEPKEESVDPKDTALEDLKNEVAQLKEKLETKEESVAVVEEEEEAKPEEGFQDNDGDISLSKVAYENFNKEIRERVM